MYCWCAGVLVEKGVEFLIDHFYLLNLFIQFLKNSTLAYKIQKKEKDCLQFLRSVEVRFVESDITIFIAG